MQTKMGMDYAEDERQQPSFNRRRFYMIHVAYTAAIIICHKTCLSYSNCNCLRHALSYGSFVKRFKAGHLS